ncbi:MAG: hypothetical protein A4E57_04556 [Syntrophorhabdaceae bacterium PtaU1.Bin034]|nr:MAG: hypothetical protein A4E57_04556 [Syntrophorhabdaceae bacterium PtaU1.Bin034]
MRGMPKILLSAALAAALFGCSPSFNIYEDNMFQGKRLLGRGEYAQARDDFVRAAQAQPDAYSYAFAATASYKMNDLASADRFIQEAMRLDGRTFSYLRILGYRALILLAEGKQKEGLDALHDYLVAYERAYPLTTISQVQDMWNTGRVNLPLLELLLDEQIRTYEDDIEQFYSTGTGWYGDRYRRAFLP